MFNNNNTNSLYNPNMHASRVDVDALLRNLGAEPLFNRNDSHMIPASPHVPPLNNNVKPLPITYPVQQNQNVISDAFVSLLQKINSQQNISNISNMQSMQNVQNMQNSQILPNSHQEIQQNSSQVGLPNPISILNEMHQRQKRSTLPPKYSFSLDPTTGYFYCQLEAFGKIFKTDRPTLRKQQAKEEAALIALRNLVDENNTSGRSNESDIMRLYDPNFNYSTDNRTETKSESWYKKQIKDFPGKQPRVILLEFCQMHHLPSPIFHPFNDYSGNTYYECIVGDKCFKGDKSFTKSSEAKDYAASLAFRVLYNERCELERNQMRRPYETGHDTKSSLLNFIESQASISTSSSTISSTPHSSELTTRLLLPSLEGSNYKVEDNSSSIIMSPSAIKAEENNIYSPSKDQQQSSSSSISYHPYRSPGRDRFQQNIGLNQFTKKNVGFNKKFTSLLFEMAQARRWIAPEFNYENGINGFVCVCRVQDYLFKGRPCSRKMDAKESAAEEAYRHLTSNRA